MFRSKAEKKVREAGYDPARLPPGQYLTEKWPVLHAGSVPNIDLATWDFRVFGEVENELALTLGASCSALPQREVTQDIHCVTRWSRFDTSFRGVHWRELAKLVPAEAERALRDRARRAGLHGERAARVARATSDALLAYEADGEPLTPEHGWPLRLVDPRQVLLEERQVAARDRALARPTSPASGSATATTTTPTTGRRSATASDEDHSNEGLQGAARGGRYLGYPPPPSPIPLEDRGPRHQGRFSRFRRASSCEERRRAGASRPFASSSSRGGSLHHPAHVGHAAACRRRRRPSRAPRRRSPRS